MSKQRLWMAMAGLVLALTCVAYIGAEAQAADISLVINGEQVQTDVPPTIEEGRVLVPVRVVSETLGAEVDWNHDAREATVETDRHRLVLPTRENRAVLDGESRELDVPPMIEEGRVLLPVRFVVEETLGAWVEWEQEAQNVGTVMVEAEPASINEVKVREEPWGQSVAFSSDRALDPEVSAENGELRARVPRAQLEEGTEKTLEVDEGLIRGVEVREEGEDVLVEVDLEHDTSPWEQSEKEQGFTLDVLAELTGLEHELRIGTEELVFPVTGPVETSVEEAEGGEVLKLDFPRVPLAFDDGLRQVDSDLIEHVYISEYEGGGTSVALRLQHPTSHQLELDAEQLRLSLHPVITGLDYQGNEGRGELRVDATGPLQEVEESVEDSPHRVMLELEEAVLAEDVEELEIDSEAVTTAWAWQESRNPDRVQVVVESPTAVQHSLDAPEGQSEMVLELIASPLHDMTVVVDPGHGGRDPGAESPGGLAEKEVAWDISSYLEERLREVGADVVMTRDGDEYVSLEERVEITEEAEAEVFLSVHSNAAPRSEAHGLETFHKRGADSKSRELARSIQEQMVEELEMGDRGVKEANFTVLLYDDIPAALAEVGFLTNPEDEELLQKDSFRRQAADALFHGLEEYAD